MSRSYKRYGSIVGVVALASLVALSAPSAQAAPPEDSAPPRASASWLSKNPIAVAKAADAAGYIIVPRADSFEYGGGTMYPTGPISPDTLVVIPNPDGSLPAGLTKAALDRMVAAKRQGVDPASIFSGDVSTMAATAWVPGRGVNVGSHIGWNSSSRASYSYNTWEYTAATGSGLGYEHKCISSTYCGPVAAYYFVGIANQYTNYNNGGSVPWGNVAANRNFLGRCTSTLTCGGIAS